MYINTLPMLASFAINPVLLTVLIVIAVLCVILFLLYRFGTKLQQRQDDAQTQMQANSQTVSMLIIDKKRLKLADSGLPKIVMEQTPKYLRRSKLPIAKVKVGPKITSMICDEKVFDVLPVKKEVKAVVSGIYIMDVKGLHAGLSQPTEKKGFFRRMRDKAQNKVDEIKKEEKKAGKK